MVLWSVKILEYNIKYILRGSIKSQALADFVTEISSLIDEELP